ncbi:MAG: response regulator [Tepidisphaeraceae bacterium]
MNPEIHSAASADKVVLRESRAGTSVIAGFAISLALVAGVMFLVYTRTTITMDDELRVEHTRGVAAALDNAAVAVSDIELADSNYIRTGAARYVSARDADANALLGDLQRLRALLADDPAQNKRWGAIEPLLAEHVTRLRAAAPAAQTQIESDDLSARLAELQHEEGRLLAQQQTDLQDSINALPFAFPGILLLASIGLCIFYTMISGYIKQRAEPRKGVEITPRRIEAESSLQDPVVALERCDIRSALTAILGYCELSLEPGNPARDRLASIHGRASEIVAALNDIINMPGAAEATPGAARMEEIHSNANAAHASSIKLSPTMRFTGRVLLAEGNYDLQQVIKYYLQTTGAEAFLASDGPSASDQALLAWKQQKPFDLILMDMQMPESDGRAAMIRLRDAGYTHPIVALTANASDQERNRCFAGGCNGILSKPIDQNELLRTMRHYLQPRVASTGAAVSDPPGASADLQFPALRESFRAEIPSRIAEIGAAVLAENFSHVADLAHQLKGTADCFGLAAIGAAAGALQNAAELPEPREAMRQCFQTLTEQPATSAVPKAA